MTEKQISDEIDNFFKMSRGVPAFDTIVASGENSSVPHWSPGSRKIDIGDVITIDMGCSYNGYTSDMTRTIFVKEINEDIKKIYDLVLDNQEIALNELKNRGIYKNNI